MTPGTVGPDHQELTCIQCGRDFPAECECDAFSRGFEAAKAMAIEILQREIDTTRASGVSEPAWQTKMRIMALKPEVTQ